MSKKKETATTTEEATGQGRVVVLPNGQKRVEYIRDEYYNNSKTRSEIKSAINTMLKGDSEEESPDAIPYQIVFAATKTTDDPRIASAARKVKAAADKATKAEAATKAAAAEAKTKK